MFIIQHGVQYIFNFRFSMFNGDVSLPQIGPLVCTNYCPIDNVQCIMFNVRCSILNVQCSMSNVQRSIINVKCLKWMSDNHMVPLSAQYIIQCMMLICQQCSILNVWFSMSDVQWQFLTTILLLKTVSNAQHSVFNVQCPMFKSWMLDYHMVPLSAQYANPSPFPNLWPRQSYRFIGNLIENSFLGSFIKYTVTGN